MYIDYHMHFENGSYALPWVQGFFDATRARGIAEIGISEHSHGFVEFKPLYDAELTLDDSPIGKYQRQWLQKNKFKYTLAEYFDFMDGLKRKGYPVKTGIEVCNFKDQAQVAKILAAYPFDYVIGSVHFLNGWGYDFSNLKSHWQDFSLEELYETYVQEIERLCAAGLYDILGHPFNLRLFKILPDFDVTKLLHRAALALQKASMTMDVNTGTLYRYPIEEISPYPDFMKIARSYSIPIITSSDAHKPEDCGRYIDRAVAYAKEHGYTQVMRFEQRNKIPTNM